MFLQNVSIYNFIKKITSILNVLYVKACIDYLSDTFISHWCEELSTSGIGGKLGRR